MTLAFLVLAELWWPEESQQIEGIFGRRRANWAIISDNNLLICLQRKEQREKEERYCEGFEHIFVKKYRYNRDRYSHRRIYLFQQNWLMEQKKTDNLQALIRCEAVQGKIKAANQSDNIASIVQEYFDSPSITLAYEEISILQEDFYKDKVNEVFKQWVSKNEKNEQYHLDEFLRYWINEDEKLKLTFSSKSQKAIQKSSKPIKQEEKSRKSLKNSQKDSQRPQQDEGQDQQNQQQVQSKIHIQTEKVMHQSLSTSPKKKEDFSTTCLQKYYQHFCSLILDTPKGSTFDSIRQLYSTMNLTQWMSFCKATNLTNYKAEDRVISSIELGKIFQKYQQKNKRFIYADFKEAVYYVLELIFKEEEKIQAEGHKLIGIDCQESFNEKMRKLGVKVSENKVYFKKVNRTIHVNDLKQRKTYDKNKQEGKSKKKVKYYRTREERKQSQLMNQLNLSNLSQIKLNENMEKKLKNLSNGDDAYLKQYGKSKNGKSLAGNGVINRMDKRINSIITKMR